MPLLTTRAGAYISASVGASPFALVSSTSAFAADATQAGTSGSPINTTGADLLILCASTYPGGSIDATSLTDHVGGSSNTWTALTPATNVGNTQTCIFYSKPTHVGAGHYIDVVGVGGSGIYPTIVFAAFSGSHASPVDVQAQGTGSSSTASAGSGITPTQNNELVLAAVSHQAAGSVPTIGSPSFDGILGNFAYSPGLYIGGALAYKIQTAAAAVDPDWALSSSVVWAAAIASFKAV